MKIVTTQRPLVLSSGPDNFDAFASMALRRPVNFGVSREDHARLALGLFRFGALITQMAIEGGGGHNWNFRAVIPIHEQTHTIEGWFCNKRGSLERPFKGEAIVSRELYEGILECASWIGVTAIP